MEYQCKEYDKTWKLTLRDKTERQVQTSDKNEKPEKGTHHELSYLTEGSIWDSDSIHASCSLYDSEEKYSENHVWNEISESDILYGKIYSGDSICDGTDIPCHEKCHTESEYVKWHAQEWVYDVRWFHGED